MKRKPIDIVADIINSLNGYQEEKKFNINSMKERSNLHWNTSKDYLYLIYFIQKFAPELDIINSNKNEFKIRKYSKLFTQFSLEEQIIIHLFLEKAFDLDTSININSMIESQFDINELDDSKFIRIFKSGKNHSKIYLSLKGRFKAQGILSRINEKMADFIENHNQINLNVNTPKIKKTFWHKQENITIQKIEWSCYSDNSDNNIETSSKVNKDIEQAKTATILA